MMQTIITWLWNKSCASNFNIDEVQIRWHFGNSILVSMVYLQILNSASNLGMLLTVNISLDVIVTQWTLHCKEIPRIRTKWKVFPIRVDAGKKKCFIILWKRCKALSEFPRFPDGPDDKVSGNSISSLSWLYKGNSYMHCLGVTELPKQCHIWCSDLALPMR